MSNKQRKTLVTTLAGVLIALMGFLSSVTATMYSDRQKLEDRVSTLELAVNHERDLRYQSDITKLTLQHELSKSFKIIDVIQAYIDAMPFPAWIKKRLESGEFEMLIINRAYEIAFDISKLQYQGHKDSDVWPKDIAEGYRALDEKVYHSKKEHCADEKIIKDGVKQSAHVCKFPIRLNDKKYGVGGVIVN